MPISQVGVVAGSKGEAPSVMVGITSVPASPMASWSAPINPRGPPSTGRTARNEVCTSSTPPRRTPSARSCAATSSRVIGASMQKRGLPLVGGVLRVRLLQLFVGDDVDLDAAVLRPALGGSVARDRMRLAQAFRHEPRAGDAGLREVG